jgi:hypothetical protein
MRHRWSLERRPAWPEVRRTLQELNSLLGDLLRATERNDRGAELLVRRQLHAKYRESMAKHSAFRCLFLRMKAYVYVNRRQRLLLLRGSFDLARRRCDVEEQAWSAVALAEEYCELRSKRSQFCYWLSLAKRLGRRLDDAELKRTITKLKEMTGQA